jgi:archaellum component FlaC
MTTTEVGLILTISVQVVGVLIWGIRKEGDLRVINERVKNIESVTSHLTRASEGIKDELNTLKGDIKNINTNIEYIKEAIQSLKK